MRTSGAVLVAIVIGLAGCSGADRIDLPCRGMYATVAYEMRRDTPTVPILDVRDPKDRQPRAVGASEIPLAELSGQLGALEAYREVTLIVIGSDWEEGRLACELLASHGFRYVVHVLDGARAWFEQATPPKQRASR